jgi:hypothetical protein
MNSVAMGLMLIRPHSAKSRGGLLLARLFSGSRAGAGSRFPPKCLAKASASSGSSPPGLARPVAHETSAYLVLVSAR